MSNQTGKTELSFLSMQNNSYRLAGGKEAPNTRTGILSYAKRYRIILNTPISGFKTISFNGYDCLIFFRKRFKTVDKANVMARCSIIEL